VEVGSGEEHQLQKAKKKERKLLQPFLTNIEAIFCESVENKDAGVGRDYIVGFFYFFSLHCFYSLASFQNNISFRCLFAA
jgi:hypothetical protein